MCEDLSPRNLVHDKDEAAAALAAGPVGRPLVEPFGVEHRVLHGLNHRRPVRAVGKTHDALDPQQIVTALAGEATKRASEIEPADLAAEADRKRVDAVA